MRYKSVILCLIFSLLLSIFCGCNTSPQSEYTASIENDTGGDSFVQQDEIVPPEALIIETAQQYYRVQFADPRNMIYVEYHKN